VVTRYREWLYPALPLEGLASSADIDSCTIASRLHRWDKGIEALGGRDIVILDEAGMVGSRQMARVVERVKSAGAKLVLVGDTEQLQAIDAGACFRAIVQQVGATRLEHVIRQQETWQRDLTQQLALGYTASALSSYHQAGHVHEYPTQKAAMFAMVEHWQETRSNHPDKRLIMLAYTRESVYALNQQARQARLDNGEIGEGTSFQTERGERHFAAGDVVYFLRNEYLKLQVKNGTLGIVSQVKGQQLQVELYSERAQEKRQVQVNVAHYPYIDHGYAATVHKAQGVTVDRSFVLASNYFDKHTSYVAMSRHREGAELYWGKDMFPSLEAMTGALERARHKEFSADYSAVRDIEPVGGILGQTQRDMPVEAEITSERFKDAESRMAARAVDNQIAVALEDLNQQMRKPIVNEIMVAGEQGIYLGQVELGERHYGLLEQADSIKLMTLEQCDRLQRGQEVVWQVGEKEPSVRSVEKSKDEDYTRFIHLSDTPRDLDKSDRESQSRQASEPDVKTRVKTKDIERDMER